MRSILALFLAVFVSSTLYAEFVTSPLSGVAVTFLAEEGSTVKKGEVLYKFEDWYIKNRIQKKKFELKIAEADMNDKKTDIARAEKLYKMEVISLAEHENIIVDFYKSKFAVCSTNVELKQMELELESYVFKAPYDCKVMKNIISVNSGLGIGKKIMEIEAISNNSK